MFDQQVHVDQSHAASQKDLHQSPSKSTSKAGVYQTPPPSQATSEVQSPDGSFNMHYYLTQGLGGAAHRKFVDNNSFAGAVKSRTKALLIRNGGQYLVFSPVSEEQLAKIERLRDAKYKQLHFLYINPAQTLIAKLMPSGIHEAATSEFGRMLWKKTARMGGDLDEDLLDMRGTRYKGLLSSKEADSAFRPESARPDEANWPTVVVESGVSETLDRLRVDAKWWLHNSSGDVRIVLLFAIKEVGQEILIEQWELCPTKNQAITSKSLHPKDVIAIPTCAASANILPIHTAEPEADTPIATSESDPPAATPANPPEPAVGAPVNPSEPAAVTPINPPNFVAITSADDTKPVGVREGINLNFEKIFVRKPHKGSAEKDIEFTRQDLQKWAQKLWRQRPSERTYD